MASVSYEAATRTFPGSSTPAVDRLDLEVPTGSLCAILGGPGSGKSTALRMLAGLEEVDGGRILVDGRDVTRVPPQDRGVVMVFENYALYPHMTVAQNLGFPLRVEGVPADEVASRVAEVAEVLEMTAQLAEKPSGISGMERHLVALGRALVRRPSVLLMDDPLDNLTRTARAQTSAHLRALQQRLDVTTLYATAHADDALDMADSVALMERGRILHVGTPDELRDHPFLEGLSAATAGTAPAQGRGADTAGELAP